MRVMRSDIRGKSTELHLGFVCEALILDKRAALVYQELSSWIARR
jgi:hypothetical protein